MSSKKSLAKKGSSEIKYCSDRCRNRKPGAADRRIETGITRLLDGGDGSGIEKTAAESRKIKGDRRVVVTMEEIEEVVFGRAKDPEKVFGRNKNRRKRALPEKGEWKSVDMESTDDGWSANEEAEFVGRVAEGDHIRPSQLESEVNFSVGGERGKQEKIEENEEMKGRRDEGQRRAEEKEIVRRAARRGVIFGFTVDVTPDMEGAGTPLKGGGVSINKAAGAKKRKCEALMNGAVVEPSFAKGNWSLRWRE